MLMNNQTSFTGFILLGLTEDEKLKIPLFVLFLVVYIITLLGNIGIMALISKSPCLHSPMYFFLSILSCVDLCYSTIIVPNMLINFLSKLHVITYLECVTQLFFFVDLAGTEGLLLGVMAYDRYNAICNPLHYTVIMTKKMCVSLVAAACTFGTVNSLINTGFIFRLKFCSDNLISHFYCDIPPLLKIACSDTTLNEVVLFTVAGCVEVGSLLTILISYTYIILAIIKIQSSAGKQKAFSTCASHIVCVTMLYVPVLFMYLRPSSVYGRHQDKVASLFYTVITPMLNPIIYSLRNKDVKRALSMLAQKRSIV
ncbi:olfactory receptor 5J3-like [Ambystoma mexicanum]|uniref:olfactory receptor 5J3-like n=1 Tax=Ambystoma mexicanum TaxID=8296 RepID=UPI0037E8AC1A